MKVSTDSCLFGAWITKIEKEPVRVLDIGAGTGLLMLMLAQRFNSPIEGIEIDEICYGQLLENIGSSPWYSKLNVFLGDVRKYEFDRNYDLIISNPPFYEKQLKANSIAHNTARHSTDLSFEELFTRVASLLNPGGKFAILIPYYRTEETINIAKSNGLNISSYAIVRHSPAHDWYRSMMIFSTQQIDTEVEQIDVHDDQGNYSPAFSELLKDYYLFL